MDSSMSIFYAAAGLPALVSTGITFIYFFLKACSYIFNAISHQTKGRVATAMPSSGQQEHCTDTGEEGHTEVCDKYKEIFQNNMAEGQNDPQGPFFYQERGKTYASLPLGMIKDIQKSPLFEKMQKDCKAEGIKLPKNIMAKDPRTHVLIPQEYLRNVEAGTMPPMDNHEMLKEMAEKVTVNDQTKFLMMEFRDFKRPSPPTMPGPQKRK